MISCFINKTKKVKNNVENISTYNDSDDNSSFWNTVLYNSSDRGSSFSIWLKTPRTTIIDTGVIIGTDNIIDTIIDTDVIIGTDDIISDTSSCHSCKSIISDTSSCHSRKSIIMVKTDVKNKSVIMVNANFTMSTITSIYPYDKYSTGTSTSSTSIYPYDKYRQNCENLENYMCMTQNFDARTTKPNFNFKIDSFDLKENPNQFDLFDSKENPDSTPDSNNNSIIDLIAKSNTDSNTASKILITILCSPQLSTIPGVHKLNGTVIEYATSNNNNNNNVNCIFGYSNGADQDTRLRRDQRVW